MTDSTLLSATTNATSLANTLDMALWVPRTIADRPAVQEGLSRMARDPLDAAVRQALLGLAGHFVATGADGVRFEAADGSLIASAGTLLGGNAASVHPLTVAQPSAQLLWQDGYVLAAVSEVRVAGQLVGRVLTEQRLPIFDALLNAIRASNDSADALICSLDGAHALCAPSRFYAQPFKVPMFDAAGELNLPANRAVAGETGVSMVQDLRDVEVVAAFAPVARYGLGFVVKSDVQTLFEPVRAQIRMLGLLLVALVTAGTGALLVRVRPLLQQVMHEQRRTRVILENSNDAFIAMDVHGKITDWNAAAERTFGWPRDQAIGKDMARLVIPASQRAAHHAGFAHFLRTGEGPVVNQRLEVMALHADGREIPVELAVAVLQDHNGYSANAFARDISERRAAEARLALSEQRLRDITDNVPAMISVFDRHERLTFVNPQCAAVYRMTREEMLGKTVLDIRGAQDHRQLQPYIDRVLAGEQVTFESTSVLNGKTHCFQQNYVPQLHADGTVQGFYSVSFDVTERRQSEERARRSEKRLRDITDNLPALISYIDSEQHLTFLNATFHAWQGVDPDSVLGRTLLDVIGPTLYAERRPFLEQALAGQRVAFEVESQALGIRRSLQTEYIPDLAPDGKVLGIYTISTDVSRLKSVERQLGVLARNDPLTGLANRYAFNEKLAEALARAQRTHDVLALLFLDVDRFKAINDQFGHATGDAVLKEVAARLVTAVRATDTVARLAGDEFVVVLESLRSAAEAKPVVQKVLAQFAEPFLVEGCPCKSPPALACQCTRRAPSPQRTCWRAPTRPSTARRRLGATNTLLKSNRRRGRNPAQRRSAQPASRSMHDGQFAKVPPASAQLGIRGLRFVDAKYAVDGRDDAVGCNGLRSLRQVGHRARVVAHDAQGLHDDRQHVDGRDRPRDEPDREHRATKGRGVQ